MLSTNKKLCLFSAPLVLLHGENYIRTIYTLNILEKYSDVIFVMLKIISLTPNFLHRNAILT